MTILGGGFRMKQDYLTNGKNSVISSNNVDYIYGELSDGSLVKIAKSDMAELIKEQVKNNFMQYDNNVLEDCDSLGGYHSVGIYHIHRNETRNTPPMNDISGTLIYLTAGGYFVQIVICPNSQEIFERWYFTYWTEWNKWK